MKKTVSRIIFCGMGSITAVICLYIFSGVLVHSKNGFIRLFPSHFIVDSNHLDIQYNSYYIAGITESHIYLANYTAPNQMLEINYALNDVRRITLSGPRAERFAWSAMKVHVDGTGIYMMEGISPIIIHIAIPDTIMSESRPFSHFNESIPIAESSFIMNRYDAARKQDILTKVTNDGAGVQIAEYILPKQMDGIFSVDGMIHWDQQLKRIIYLYYYRNEFICLDSNLKPVYTGNTIDTIRFAHIKLTSASGEGRITFAAPPQITNKKSCVDGGSLFVQSTLMANNENPDYFKTNSVVDIYAVKNGRYRYSFYLPDFYHSKAADFCVYGNRLFALYDHYLVNFRMHP